MDEKNPVIFLFMMLGLKYFMCSKAKTLNTFSMVLEHSCTCLWLLTLDGRKIDISLNDVWSIYCMVCQNFWIFYNICTCTIYISILSVTSDLGVLMGVCLPEGEAFKTGIWEADSDTEVPLLRSPLVSLSTSGCFEDMSFWKSYRKK